MICTHLDIDPAFDLGQFRCRHRLEMREVEAQPIRCHQRAFLLHMGTQHVAQSGVQQIIELQLADDEAEKFHHAIEVIKANIARLP